MKPLYEHQKTDVARLLNTPHLFNASDPGTGKSRTTIETIRQDPERRPALILAPKSILKASWGNDIAEFAPELTYAIAQPNNRQAALDDPRADIVITNHDAVNKLAKTDTRALKRFKFVVIDESTAYKNHTAQRSIAVRALTKNTPHRVCMSGTPAPQSVLDLWHQYALVDDGERLGKRFYAFRAVCCNPTARQVGGRVFHTWESKPGIQSVIAQQVADITIRRTLDDCLEIPQQNNYMLKYTPNTAVMASYTAMEQDSLVEFQDGRIAVGIHASAARAKALQILSGAVYDDESYSLVDTERYDLVLDLVEQREHSLVAFNWKHQSHYLATAARQRKLEFAVIDGNTSYADRTDIVDRYQKGHYRVLFAHPQCAGHGLTLTKARTTIWASPTDSIEHYLQFNRRTRRAGQTEKTEVINICATNTLEENVYKRNVALTTDQNEFLEML